MKYIFLFIISLSCIASNSQLFINEVCSDNESILLDEEGDYEDWIEIYNAGNSAFNLQGYFLSDDSESLDKWGFPNVTIPANSFLLVFASDKNFNGNHPHTNFKVSKEGESLFLSSPQLDIIDQLFIPALDADLSFGRQPDGSTSWSFFYVPSPETSNNNSPGFNFANKPQFNTTDFFFNQSTTISIECDQPNCSIYYTTDGSIPDETSNLYSGPITIDTTTSVRAASITPTLLISPPTTRTIFIGETHTLPVISLTSAPENFWDYENGIFIDGPEADTIWPYFGANFWKDIEIPIYFEYFKNGNLEVEYSLGAEIHGGKGSRTKAMKSLRFLAKENIGTPIIDYQFFENKENTKFERLVLRNASGDFNICHMRDGFLARYFIDEKLNFEGLDYQPSVVYINGIYWGVMHIREKFDARYLKHNNGIDPDNVDVLEEDSFIVEGDYFIYDQHEDFVLSNDLSDDQNFEIAASYFDLNNLSDYFIAQTFFNNTDWPKNNLKYWRPRTPNAKWRYVLFDLDISIAHQGFNKAEANSFATRMEIENNHLIKVFNAFLANENYRHYFINRYADLTNSSFREEVFTEEIIRSQNDLDFEMDRHLTRWGKTYESWSTVQMPKLYTFAEKRPHYARAYISDYFGLVTQDEITIKTFPENTADIKINTLTINENQLPWNGHYFNAVPIQLTVLPKPGYTFVHWESNYTSSIVSTDSSLNIQPREGEIFTAVFAHEQIETTLNIMPNPSSDIITIEITAPNLGPVDLRIFDAAGRQVLAPQEALATTGINQFSVNIKSLADGVYYVHITGSDFSIAEQIIKSSR